MELNKIYNGDCLDILRGVENESVDCCVTSPPYFGLRDYGHDGQLGLEKTPEEYVYKMVEVFSEVKRVLKKEGTLWLNIGDSYNGSGKGGNPEGSEWSGFVGNKSRETAAQPKKEKTDILGLKPKDLIGVPWMLAFALRSDGWYLRQDIIWHKPNPMPESVTDRCTKAHEYIFLLTKSSKYYYDAESIKLPLQDQSVLRLAQKIEDKKGSDRVPGKTNGNMKAVKKQYDKSMAAGGSRINGHNGSFDRDGNLIGGELANKRSVWTVTTMPYSEAHFATFPERLIVDCIKAGCPSFVCNRCGNPREPIFDVKPMVIDRSSRREEMGQPNGIAASGTVVSNRESTFTGYSDCGCNAEFSPGIVLDPFIGAGTTGLVARKLNRNFIGIELNEKYIEIANKRLKKELGMFL